MKNEVAFWALCERTHGMAFRNQAERLDVISLLTIWAWCNKTSSIEGLPEVVGATQTKEALEFLNAEFQKRGFVGFSHLTEVVDFHLPGKDIKGLTDLLSKLDFEDAAELTLLLAQIRHVDLPCTEISSELGNFVGELLGSESETLLLEGLASLGFLPFVKAGEKHAVSLSGSPSVYAQCLAFLNEAELEEASTPLALKNRADVHVSTPALGMKLRKGEHPFISLHSDIAAVEDAVQKGKKKSVVFTLDRFLVGSVRDHVETRKLLIDQNLLDAVITLPAPLHHIDSRLTMAMVVINQGRDKGAPVLFVDGERMASSLQISTRRRKNGAFHQFWNELQEAWKEPDNSAFAAVASTEDIVANKYDLALVNYVKPKSILRLDQVRKEFPVEQLGDLVTITRTQAFRQDDIASDGQEFVEVGIRDISERGQVSPEKPEKLIQRTDSNRRQIERQTLRPNDILLVERGRPGLVGIVPEDCPDNLVAGQMFVILRLKDTSLVKPEFLLRYLAASQVQEYFTDIARGTVISVIRADDLASLPVPLLPEKQEEVLRKHRLIQEKHNEIVKITKEIQQLSSFDWLFSQSKKD